METRMIGNKITEARRKMNFSQAQLAEQLFISSQAVGKWERGESLPDILTLIRLAEILGVDLNYFSENFRSVAAENKPFETGPDKAEEIPSANLKNKKGWDMSRGNWVDADFSGLNNLHEKFSSSNMQRCKFIGSNLSGLLLKNNNVLSCDFSGSDISNSKIQSSNLSINIYKDCVLKGSGFSECNIDRCNFSGSILTETEITRSFINGCDLSGVDFTDVVIRSGGLSGLTGKTADSGKNTITNAIWRRTSFIDTHLADIGIEGTLEDCYFENCSFTRLTFRNAILKNTFFKNNKKLKKIRFTDCRADRITYEFLKQGNASLEGISLLTA
jgi:uncharacterized protein YjbI with pentapeptide repeats